MKAGAIYRKSSFRARRATPAARATQSSETVSIPSRRFADLEAGDPSEISGAHGMVVQPLSKRSTSMSTTRKISIRSLAGLSLMVAVTWCDAAAFPTGTYEAGGVVIDFGSDGRFHVSQGGKSVVEGTYKVAGDKVTLADVSGSSACPRDKASGTYIWRIEKSTLTFTKVDDPCDDRSSDMTGHPWQMR
jgi:hypothetical protein